MKRFLIALLVPIFIILSCNWRLIVSLREGIIASRSVLAANEPKLDDNQLSIPTLGIVAPIVPSQTDPLDQADWSVIRNDLTQGVSLAKKRAKPGEKGFVVITGHSSDWIPHKYSAIFASLFRLKKGDTIYLNYLGSRHTYMVSEKRVVNPYDLALFKQEPSENELLLVTCWPLLTTQKRLVVIAVLR